MGKSKRTRREERANQPYRIKQRVYDASGEDADVVHATPGELAAEALASVTGGRRTALVGASDVLVDTDIVLGGREGDAGRSAAEAAALHAHVVDVLGESGEVEMALEGDDGRGGGRQAAPRVPVRGGREVTRGALEAKQRIEWKRLRAEIEDMRAASRRLSKHVLAEKQAKKDIARRIKEVTVELKERHAAELDAWLAAARELGGGDRPSSPSQPRERVVASASSMDIVLAAPADSDVAAGTVSLFSLGGRVATPRGAPLPPGPRRKQSKKKRGRRSRLVVDF